MEIAMATIYIYLKGEGTDVWSPEKAEPVRGDIIRCGGERGV